MSNFSFLSFASFRTLVSCFQSSSVWVSSSIASLIYFIVNNFIYCLIVPTVLNYRPAAKFATDPPEHAMNRDSVFEVSNIVASFKRCFQEILISLGTIILGKFTYKKTTFKLNHPEQSKPFAR